MTTFITTLKHLSFLLILLYQSPLTAEVKVTYYIPDASGSPVAATDEQGNLKWRKHYRPFGEEIQAEPDQTNSKNNHIGYTGHVQDKNTGLTYMRARYYDPVVGRFMAMDPAPVKPGDPRTFNKYAYANNNPYKYVDTDGRASVLAEGALLVGGAFLVSSALPDHEQRVDSLRQLVGEVQNGWKVFNESGNDDAAGESGTCPTCGEKTEDKISKISNGTDKTSREVKDKIHEAKKDIPKSSATKNPDVEVCTTCGEVFPKTPGNGLGDSIGNIFD